jgi:hypothetical protein
LVSCSFHVLYEQEQDFLSHIGEGDPHVVDLRTAAVWALFQAWWGVAVLTYFSYLLWSCSLAHDPRPANLGLWGGGAAGAAESGILVP